MFRASEQKGYQIDVEFAMWGDTFEEAMQRFSDVVLVLERAIKKNARRIIIANFEYKSRFSQLNRSQPTVPVIGARTISCA